MKIGLIFISSGKQPFSKETFMILVKKGRCISTVDLSTSAGMSFTGVALELSRLKIVSRTESSGTGWNENFSLGLVA